MTVPPDHDGLGEKAIRLALACGIELDEVQRGLLVDAMSTREDGGWNFTTVGDCQPRQNGKGETAQARCIYGAAVLGERILWTAHEFLPTGKRAHERAEAALRSSELWPRVSKVRWANGESAIEFDSGGAIFYRARTRQGGRGLDDISVVVWDEAQLLQRVQMKASSPTLATADYAQRWMMGTPGDAKSEVWWGYRLQGIKGEGSLLWAEQTAEEWTVTDDGEVEFTTPDPADVDGWYKANAALRAGRISEEFFADELVALQDGFLEEHLGVWVPLEGKGTNNTKLTPAGWAAQVDVTSKVHSGLVLAVDADWDGASSVIYVAGRREDGARHVGAVASAPGIGWVEKKLDDLIAELTSDKKRPLKIGYDSTGPAKVLEPILKKATTGPIELVALAGNAYAAACAGFANGINDGDIWHRGDVETTAAVNAARIRRHVRQGAWIWHAGDGVNISPLRAATVAAWLAASVPHRVSRSMYEPDELTTV